MWPDREGKALPEIQSLGSCIWYVRKTFRKNKISLIRVRIRG